MLRVCAHQHSARRSDTQVYETAAASGLQNLRNMKPLTTDELEQVNGGVQPEMWTAMNKAWDLGLQIQGVHTGNHVANSNHWRGRAMDIGGSPAQMQKFVDWARGTKYREIIYKDQFWKDGHRIRGIGNHQDHVHYGF